MDCETSKPFERFKDLLRKWKLDHVHLSFPKEHKNTQIILDEFSKEQIIAYSILLLPNACHDLWQLLYKVVPEDQTPPCPEYYRGRIPVLVEMWIYWGLKEKHIKSDFDPNHYYYVAACDPQARVTIPPCRSKEEF